MFGETLFRPSARDIDTLGGAPTRLAFVVAAAAANVQVAVNTPICPADEVWVVTSLGAQITPGAAQFANFLTFTALDNVTNGQVLRWGTRGQPALGTTVALVTGTIETVESLIMPGEFIQLGCVFSAGGAVNTVQLSVGGIRIPRGNVIK